MLTATVDIIKEKVNQLIPVVKEKIMKTAADSINTLNDRATANIEEFVKNLDVSNISTVLDDVLDAVLDPVEKMLVAVRNSVRTGRKRLMQVHHEINHMLLKGHATFVKLSQDVKTTIVKAQSELTNFVSVISDGKSFTRRKDWNFGLMKGWSTQVYAQGSVSFDVLPAPKIFAGTKAGIDYSVKKPSRSGNLLELTLDASVSIETRTSAMGSEEYEPVFDPPLKSLVPMLSVLGSPPVPINTDPVSILEVVLPIVQKRIMDGLSDTSVWGPIAMELLKQLIEVPFVRNALGNLDLSMDGENVEDGIEEESDRLKLDYDNFVDQYQAKRTAMCTDVKNQIDEKGKSMVDALKTPFQILDSMMTNMNATWFPISRLLHVVDEQIKLFPSELSEVKNVVCLVQDRFFAVQSKGCNYINDLIAVVGSKVSTIEKLFAQSSSDIDCNEKNTSVTASIDAIYNKLKAFEENGVNGDGMFPICKIQPIMTTCGTVQGSEGITARMFGDDNNGEGDGDQDDHANGANKYSFVQDIMNLGKALQCIVESVASATVTSNAPQASVQGIVSKLKVCLDPSANFDVPALHEIAEQAADTVVTDPADDEPPVVSTDDEPVASVDDEPVPTDDEPATNGKRTGKPTAEKCKQRQTCPEGSGDDCFDEIWCLCNTHNAENKKKNILTSEVGCKTASKAPHCEWKDNECKPTTKAQALIELSTKTQVKVNKMYDAIHSTFVALTDELGLGEDHFVMQIVASGIECQDTITVSMNTVTTVIDDFKEIYNQMKTSIMKNGGRPFELLKEFIAIFQTLADKAQKNLNNAKNIPYEMCLEKLQAVGNKVALVAQNAGITVPNDAAEMKFRTANEGIDKVSSTVHEVSNTIHGLVSMMERIIPKLEAPMNQIVEIAHYIPGAFECVQGLIPPIKSGVDASVDLYSSEIFDPDHIRSEITRIVDGFKQPMECTEPNIVAPLMALIKKHQNEPMVLKATETLANNERLKYLKMKSDKLVEKVKKTANAIVKTIPLIQKMIETGMKIYSTVKEVVETVKAFIKNANNPAETGGAYTKAMSTTRAFKTGVAEITFVLRELRDMLHLLPLDDGTMLAILEGAEKTMVGLDSACDVVINMLESPPNDSEESMSLLETSTTLRMNQKTKKSRKKRSLRHAKEMDESVEEQAAEVKPIVMDDVLEALVKKIDSLEASSNNAQMETKIDTLQSTSDKISRDLKVGLKAVAARGGAGGSGGNSEATSEDSLRAASKKFQRGIEIDANKLTCPPTHHESTPAEKQLLITKEVDILKEHITVPQQYTYGINVKIGIMIRAVANAYLDSVSCDCHCTATMKSPCAGMLMIGPSVQLHLIGTGAISVGVKILKISGTVNLQLGSIYADTAVHISRVSQDPSDSSLCLKDTGPANATFAAGFKADLAAEILKGSFQLDVKIFGIKLPVPNLSWNGLRWELGHFCFEPSARVIKKLNSFKKLTLRPLQPQLCPTHSNFGFQPLPKEVKASVRPKDKVNAGSCSICQINEDYNNIGEDGQYTLESQGQKGAVIGAAFGGVIGAAVGGIIGSMDSAKTAMRRLAEGSPLLGWTCKHPPSRILAMAGYTDMKHVNMLGEHFTNFMRTQHLDLRENLDLWSGLFNEEQKQFLKDDIERFDSLRNEKQKRAPFLNRLFTSSKQAAIEDTVEKFTSDLIIKENPYSNRYKHISNIFLCGETVTIEKDKKNQASLLYQGDIYIRYNLDKKLKRRVAPSTKKMGTKSELIDQDFVEERDRIFDTTSPFMLPFSFAMRTPRLNSEQIDRKVDPSLKKKNEDDWMKHMVYKKKTVQKHTEQGNTNVAPHVEWVMDTMIEAQSGNIFKKVQSLFRKKVKLKSRYGEKGLITTSDDAQILDLKSEQKDLKTPDDSTSVTFAVITQPAWEPFLEKHYAKIAKNLPCNRKDKTAPLAAPSSTGSAVGDGEETSFVAISPKNTVQLDWTPPKSPESGIGKEWCSECCKRSSPDTCQANDVKSYTGTLGIFKKKRMTGEKENKKMSCETNNKCGRLCRLRTGFRTAKDKDCRECKVSACGAAKETATEENAAEENAAEENAAEDNDVEETNDSDESGTNKIDAAEDNKDVAKNIDAQDLSKEDTAKVQEMEVESMTAGYITSLRQNTMKQYKERYAAPDPIAEYTAFDWCGEGANDHKRVLSTDPMLILSPTLNTFQVTSSGEDGSYHVGTVADGCARPVSVGGVFVVSSSVASLNFVFSFFLHSGCLARHKTNVNCGKTAEMAEIYLKEKSWSTTCANV